MQYTQKFSERINKLKDALQSSETIVIGAGSGLSSAAGFTYSGERFFKYFSDFHAKYGITDMYSGGFYPFLTEEEYWAYWSRYIYINRYIKPPKPVYEQLFELVKDKNYFVITTNVDHCFQKAGFDKQRLFYTQGDYGLLQCSVPCHDKTYDNEEMICRMVKEQRNMRIPSELIPHCPICGAPMTMNLRADDKFVEDEGWYAALNRYENFLTENSGKKVLFLELGVGYNTPGIIKYPFMKMTFTNKNARYVVINKESDLLPNGLISQTLQINEDISDVLMRCVE